MFVFFFVLWLVLNGHFELDTAFLEIIIFGLAVSAIIFLFMMKFTKWDMDFEKFFVKNLHLFIIYGFVLFWNVVISNFKVITTVLSSKENVDPILVTFNIPLKDEMLRTILANSITLTPGTITISVTKTHYLVHCLKKEYFDGFESCALVKILLRLEAKK